MSYSLPQTDDHPEPSTNPAHSDQSVLSDSEQQETGCGVLLSAFDPGSKLDEVESERKLGLSQSTQAPATLEESSRRRKEEEMAGTRELREPESSQMDSPLDPLRTRYPTSKDQETLSRYSLASDKYDQQTVSEETLDPRPHTPPGIQLSELSVISEKRSGSLSIQSGGREETTSRACTPFIPALFPSFSRPSSPPMAENHIRPQTEPRLVGTSPDIESLGSEDRLISPNNAQAQSVLLEDVELRLDSEKSIGTFPSQPLTRQRSLDDPPPPSQLILPLLEEPDSLDSRQASKTLIWSFEECLSALKASNFQSFVPAGRIKQPRSWWKTLLVCCKSRPRLSQERRADFDFLLALERRPLGSQQVDIALLASLWQCHFPEEQFTPESPVWLSLGFRTSDPRAEASTLCFLQLLYLAQKQPDLCNQLLLRSLRRGALFRFSLEVCAITRLAAKIAKSGSLTSLLIDSEDVFATFNEYFAGALRLWLEEQGRSQGQVDWQLLETRLRRNPRAVLRSAHSVP